MASTIAVTNRIVQGNRYVRNGTGNLGVYATSGVAITRGQLELGASIKDLRIDNAGGYNFEVSALTDASATVKAYRQKDPANAGGADIPAPEVANSVDLSAVTFRYRAEGH